MGRVYLEYQKNKCKWREVEKSNFWIDGLLLDKLKNVRSIQKKNWDAVILIDGKERSGKSVLAMIMGWYLSNQKLNKNNYARGLDDVARKIATIPDKSVIILDEGSTIFGAKDSMSTAQKKLIKIMDVVGQKNLIFIICLPSFFDLNKTIAIRRSLFFLHVYPTKTYERGQFVMWGEKGKKLLYLTGKKNYDSYAKPKPTPAGEFFNFEPPFYKEYLEEVKKESLNQVINDAVGDNKRDVDAEIRKVEGEFYHYLKMKKGYTYRELQEIRNQTLTLIKERVYAISKQKKEENDKEL